MIILNGTMFEFIKELKLYNITGSKVNSALEENQNKTFFYYYYACM